MSTHEKNTISEVSVSINFYKYHRICHVVFSVDTTENHCRDPKNRWKMVMAASFIRIWREKIRKFKMLIFEDHLKDYKLIRKREILANILKSCSKIPLDCKEERHKISLGSNQQKRDEKLLGILHQVQLSCFTPLFFHQTSLFFFA